MWVALCTTLTLNAMNQHRNPLKIDSLTPQRHESTLHLVSLYSIFVLKIGQLLIIIFFLNFVFKNFRFQFGSWELYICLHTYRLLAAQSITCSALVMLQAVLKNQVLLSYSNSNCIAFIKGILSVCELQFLMQQQKEITL